jgi:putative DNA primase/helicase
MSAANLPTAASDPAALVIAGENDDLVAEAANQSVAQTVRETAFAAASEGMRLFPLRPGQKFPPPKGWQALATTDADTISRWLTPPTSGSDLLSDAPPNIGALCGNGLMVLDLDPRNGSDESFTALEAKYGKLPRTRTARTPSGGTHYYFKVPVDREIRNDNRGKVGAGIDIKSNGGYVVLPGSRTEKGSYSWTDPTAPIAELPAQLLELVTQPRAPKEKEPANDSDAVPTIEAPKHSLTIANVRELLTHLDANCDYEQWFEICVAVRRAAKGAQDGSALLDWFVALDEWSARSSKYPGRAEVEEKWRQADTRESGYGLKHLIDLAKSSGYIPPARVASTGAFPPVTTDPGVAPPAAVDSADSPLLTGAVKLISGDEIEPEPYDWLWPEMLARGKFHVFAGAPGCGKTTVALSLAATLTSGGKWPDGTRAPVSNVLIWSGEDDVRDTLLPRLIAAGADRSRIKFVDSVDAGGGRRRSFDPALDLTELLVAAKKVGNVGLLIVDPIVNAVTGDSHKNTETRRSLQPLVDLAQSLNAALLGISHFTKGTAGRDPIERVTGSLAFGAMPRVVFVAAKVVDEGSGDVERIFVRAKSNIGPDGDGFRFELAQVGLPNCPGLVASTVQWGDQLEGAARELLKEAEGAGESNKTEDAAELIQQTIREKGGEASATDLHAALGAAGIGKHSRYRAINGLLEQHRITRVRYVENGPWTYIFPRRGGVADVSAFDPAAPAANGDLVGEVASCAT